MRESGPLEFMKKLQIEFSSISTTTSTKFKKKKEKNGRNLGICSSVLFPCLYSNKWHDRELQETARKLGQVHTQRIRELTFVLIMCSNSVFLNFTFLLAGLIILWCDCRLTNMFNCHWEYLIFWTGFYAVNPELDTKENRGWKRNSRVCFWRPWLRVVLNGIPPHL